MSESNQGNNGQVHLDRVERELGAIDELDPAKVRLNLAKWILIGVFVLVTGSAVALLYSPSDRLEEAKVIFEFSKTFGPPIVTLVIGFYFRSEGTT
ncbi:MAG TPA: hypothetical protein VGH81_14420 [Rudaea sp.]|jgi:hypothetical protein